MKMMDVKKRMKLRDLMMELSVWELKSLQSDIDARIQSMLIKIRECSQCGEIAYDIRCGNCVRC